MTSLCETRELLHGLESVTSASRHSSSDCMGEISIPDEPSLLSPAAGAMSFSLRSTSLPVSSPRPPCPVDHMLHILFHALPIYPHIPESGVVPCSNALSCTGLELKAIHHALAPPRSTTSAEWAMRGSRGERRWVGVNK